MRTTAIPILRGNFPLFRCSAHHPRTSPARPVAAPHPRPYRRTTILPRCAIPHRSTIPHRPRFPACRLFVKYARLLRIEISLNSARSGLLDCFLPVFAYDFSLPPSILPQPLAHSISLSLFLTHAFPLYFRVIQETRKRESDTIPGITVSGVRADPPRRR